MEVSTVEGEVPHLRAVGGNDYRIGDVLEPGNAVVLDH
jgi:hypothetical protein